MIAIFVVELGAGVDDIAQGKIEGRRIVLLERFFLLSAQAAGQAAPERRAD